ncbi:MAG: DUF4157 domain-containing protein [Bradymonadales bacterium]|nr:DUF4157 domain-containing protein [Bradymonadales bacterium]
MRQVDQEKGSGTGVDSVSSTGSGSGALDWKVQLQREVLGLSYTDQATALTPPAPTMLVQTSGGADQASADSVKRSAAQGIQGTGSPLPYLDRIQAAFGGHDLSGVQAHVGGPAAEATRSMGATAYATGNHVAFRSEPDLHTAAHEAAHVVQQRSGVNLAGGVGRAGDRYERQADAVAERVVQGKGVTELFVQRKGSPFADAIQMLKDGMVVQEEKESKQSKGADGGLVNLPVKHSRMTLGQLEQIPDRAGQMEPGSGDLEKLITAHCTYTPLPTSHCDTLLADCDKDMEITKRVLNWAKKDGDSKRAARLEARLAKEQAGKKLILQDKVEFGKMNVRLLPVVSSLALFGESGRYMQGVFAGLQEQIGLDTFENWCQNPLPPAVTKKIDSVHTNAGSMGTTGSLQNKLGMGVDLDNSKEKNTSEPTRIAQKMAGLHAQALGLTEQRKAGALQVLSALRSGDVELYQKQIDDLQAVVNGYGVFVDVCKGVVDISTGSWFGAFADAMKGVVGWFGKEAAAVAEAKKIAAKNKSINKAIDAGFALEAGAELQAQGISLEVSATAADYSAAINQIREVRNSRRQALVDIGSKATGGKDKNSGDIAGRLMLVGAVMEVVTMAINVRRTIADNKVQPEEVRKTWQETENHRANNPISSLSYPYTPQECKELANGVMVWSWTHPSEDAAFQKIIDFSETATQIANVFINKLRPFAAYAQSVLQKTLHKSKLEY